MGRVKSLMIKKTAKQLYEEVEGFNDSFENNKKLLNNTLPYKSMRNQVAGAIIRLAQKKATEK